MEKTLKNGKRYSFEELWQGFIKAYCFYDNRWNPLSISFKTWDEVDAWCEKLDHEFERPQEGKPVNVPQDYYGREGVYYGD